MVEIKIQNGKKPYYWYIDAEGKEVYGDELNEVFEYGGHTILIIDTKGDTIYRDIWVDKPEC